ncbi:MAG TPA: PQQ-binding-like beta-propeller repeat protein [Planctomycetota bacterium]|nr:PQQ-binding-like beta-propeller repeat protein [Planctomycetota bacterium]
MGIARWAPLSLLLVSLARAEPDGAVAEPSRWTGPNGPPSNSRRSRALPVTRDVICAWKVPLPGPAAAPPVTWDGMAYVLCAAGDNMQLVAVDAAKGALVAKKILPGAPAAPIHVWGGVVYAFSRPSQVSGFRPIGSSFVEKWKFGLDGAGHTMTVSEGEMYIAGGGGLCRASPGLRDPLWSAPGSYSGPPAVYGDSVLAVLIGRDGIPTLQCHHRGTGCVGSKAELGWPAANVSRGDDVDITAGAGDLLVRTSWPMRMQQGTASDAFVGCTFEGNQLVRLATEGFMNFRVKAAVYKGGLITCEDSGAWCWWQGDKGQVVAERKTAPDLFRELLPPTVVGNIVYFGTWAADVETGEILWRLPLRGVRFGVVPLDRLLLVVDGEGNLQAFKSRVGR